MRSAGGRRSSCKVAKERHLACLRGSGGGQLRAPQFKNVLPAVKPAVEGADIDIEIPFMKSYTVFNAEQIDGLPVCGS